jgi:UDP:flavonoid glycosyltransferase YjiC (YdhE family)
VDAPNALEQLRGKLEGSFGKALSMLILASCCNVAGVSLVGITDEEFRRLVEAVGHDQRVVDMWGAAGAADAANQWRELLN